MHLDHSENLVDLLHSAGLILGSFQRVPLFRRSGLDLSRSFLRVAAILIYGFLEIAGLEVEHLQRGDRRLCADKAPSLRDEPGAETRLAQFSASGSAPLSGR